MIDMNIKLAIKSILKAIGVLFGIVFFAIGSLWLLDFLNSLPNEVGMKVSIGVVVVALILVGSIGALIFYDASLEKEKP